jgi:hypothetical protein
MYSLKLITFAGLLLVSQVLASRVSYVAWDKTGGVDKSGKLERKLGGPIPDEEDDDVLLKMGEWSEARFWARRHDRTGIIIVEAVERDNDKSRALALIAEAQHIVQQNLGQQA